MGTKNTIEFIDSIYEEFYGRYLDEWNDFKYLLDDYSSYIKDFNTFPESLDEPLFTKKELGSFDYENIVDFSNILEKIIYSITRYDEDNIPQYAINKLRDDLHNIASTTEDEELQYKIYDDYLHFINEVFASRRVLNNFITCLGLFM